MQELGEGRGCRRDSQGEQSGEWQVGLVSIVAEALASEEESDDPGELSSLAPFHSASDVATKVTQLLTTNDLFFFSAQVDGDFGIFDLVVA